MNGLVSNYPGNMNMTANDTARETQLRQRVNELEKAAGANAELVGMLEQRLNPVLMPGCPVAGGRELSQAEPMLVPLASAVRGPVQVIERTNMQLQELLTRLEV
jgi:hypothetical protein